MLENPPEEKFADVSGLIPVVAPTCFKSLTALTAVIWQLTDVKKGHPEGNVGTKVVLQDCFCVPETPPSPEEKIMDVPLAPSCIYALHKELVFER